jgi:hypothetical protein
VRISAPVRERPLAAMHECPRWNEVARLLPRRIRDVAVARLRRSLGRSTCRFENSNGACVAAAGVNALTSCDPDTRHSSVRVTQRYVEGVRARNPHHHSVAEEPVAEVDVETLGLEVSPIPAWREQVPPRERRERPAECSALRIDPT